MFLKPVISLFESTITANDADTVPAVMPSNKFNSSKELRSEEIFNNNKFYLLNIWASWCKPCRDEHPFLMKLSENKNIKIIGLNYKDSITVCVFFKFNKSISVFVCSYPIYFLMYSTSSLF